MTSKQRGEGGPRLKGPLEHHLLENRGMISSLRGSLLGTVPAAKTIYVTSPFAGDGKSTSATALAYGLAGDGSRVLLLDANFKSPVLNQFFGAPPEPGLSDYLSGERSAEEIVRTTLHKNLSLLTAGTSTKDGEHPSTERLPALIAALGQEFDYLVADGESMLQGSLLLAGLFDASLLVVSCEQTKWQVAQMAIEKVENLGSRVAGVVLNKRQYYIPSFLYSKV